MSEAPQTPVSAHKGPSSSGPDLWFFGGGVAAAPVMDEHGVPELPQLAVEINGKTYRQRVPSDDGEALPLPASSFHTFLK